MKRIYRNQFHEVHTEITLSPSPDTGEAPVVDISSLSITASLSYEDIKKAIHNGVELACLKGVA